MTKSEFENLKIGDQVKHVQNTMVFVVADIQDSHVTAVSTVCMRIAKRWEKVEKI